MGAVAYLNTKPLVYQLGRFAPEAELRFDVPSRLAEDLASGNLDVALIPSIEYPSDPEYAIVSDACIGCRGPVLSVKLFSRVPVAGIRSLALDAGSRTSAILARVLLRERYGLCPTLETLPVGADPAAASADAVLLIGDRAIHYPSDGYVECWDLGERWYRWSGLPFVFAMWVARSSTDLGRVGRALADARDAGVANVARIARVESERAGLSVERVTEYLRDHLHFYLGERERKGLARYYRLAAELGAAPAEVALRFHASALDAMFGLRNAHERTRGGNGGTS